MSQQNTPEIKRPPVEKTLHEGTIRYSVTELPDGNIRLHFDQSDVAMAVSLNIACDHFRRLEKMKHNFKPEERAKIITTRYILEKTAYAFFEKVIAPLIAPKATPDAEPTITEQP